jgi:hypothetical protein
MSPAVQRPKTFDDMTVGELRNKARSDCESAGGGGPRYSDGGVGYPWACTKFNQLDLAIQDMQNAMRNEGPPLSTRPTRT